VAFEERILEIYFFEKLLIPISKLTALNLIARILIMPKLTVPPNFIGTPGSDTLIGEQLNASPAIGIDILTGGFICTRSGNDTVQGTGTGSIGGIGGSIEGGNANITFNSNGNSISLSTTGFEKFVFADSSFCYSSLANGA
jgi:hypothetical protein